MPQDYDESKFFPQLPYPGHTVELCSVILNDLSPSSTEDPSHGTELFLAKFLCFLGKTKN